MPLEESDLIQVGRRVLQLEATEISAAASRLDSAFARAVRLLAGAKGRVIVSGVAYAADADWLMVGISLAILLVIVIGVGTAIAGTV